MQRQVYHEIYYRLDEAVDSLVSEKMIDSVRAQELMQIINNWLDEKEDEDKQAVDGWWKFQKLWNRDGLDSAMKFVRDGGLDEDLTPSWADDEPEEIERMRAMGGNDL